MSLSEVSNYVNNAIESYYTINNEDGSWTILHDKERRIERALNKMGFWDRMCDLEDRQDDGEELSVEELEELKEDFDEMYKSL